MQSRKIFKTVDGYAFPILTPTDLVRLHDLSRQFNIDQIRFTPTSQLSVSGIDGDSFQDFRQAVIPFMEPLPTNGTIIHSCNDHYQCAHEFEDTSIIVRRLADLELEQPLPAKIKIGVAGCYRCCTMVRVRDVGIFPGARNSSTWSLSFGGNGGYNPRIGDIIATDLHEIEVIDMVYRIISTYRQHARKYERTAPFLIRYGIDNFINEIKKMKPFDSGQRVLSPKW